MKKLFFFILSLFALASCLQEPGTREYAKDIYFSIDIPAGGQSLSRAPIGSGDISSLYLLVFDEHGKFLSRHQAVMVTNYGGYKATLPVSSSKRIIHFVANYSWAGFSDVFNLAKNETEIVPTLSVGNAVIGYWQRVELSGGIAAGSFGQTISLLRNVAKVSVVNLTSGASHLTGLTFSMGDTYDRGTISPFSPSLAAPFTEGYITEAPSGTYGNTTESSFLAAGTSTASTGEPYLAYERNNSASGRPAYVIIKGYYQNSGVPNNSVYSYYKIDLADPNSGELYDLMRNNHYVIKINTVSNAGYPTLAEAMHAPASNNTLSSVLVQEFTSVSDGTSQLNVETTSRLFIKGGQAFSITYSYIPDANSGADNSGVTVTLTQDPAKPVVDGNISYDNMTGIITGTTAAIPSVMEVHTATLTVKAGSLERKITLRLRQPYSFSNIFTDPSPIANGLGQHVSLHFTIPNTINAEDFPMPVYITTKKLSPDFQAASGKDISTDFTNGQYRYKYIARNSGEQVVSFTTNSSDNAETIILEGDYMNSAPFNIVSTNQTALTNLNFIPNGDALPAQTGQTVTMTFDIPVVAGVTSPYTVKIITSKLSFVSSSTGSAATTSSGYLYTTNQTGTQTLIFKTNSADNEEYIQIYGDKYAVAGFNRLCTKMSFVNPRFDAVTGSAGTPVSMRLALPSEFDFAANDGKCEIFIYTTQLEPADGNPSGLVRVIHPQFGPGYRYTTSTKEDRAVMFKTLYPTSAETVRITAAGFNEVILVRN